MTTLLAEHALHGSMPYHVLGRVANALGVARTSLERRYGEFLRRREIDDGLVILESVERDAIRHAGTLLEAHRILVRRGRILPFALFERAIWRDGGDRSLVELRIAECARRIAAPDMEPCARCADQARPKAAAA